MGSFDRLSRRQIMRGMLAGTAVTVALPILDCALNTNGSAFAASGRPLPNRFVTWFWGLGCNPGQWEPKEIGSLSKQTLGAEMSALDSVKDKINIYTKMNVELDGRPNPGGHQGGWQGQLMGLVPRAGEGLTLPTIDTIVAEEIGKTTRFRSLVAVTAGGAQASMSYLPGGIQLPGEISSAELYARIFGPEFVDPNAADFKPDPRVMARRSVLSVIKDQRDSLARDLGSADRARLDEYFTSVRQLEQQVALQLEKPAPLAACSVPKAPEDTKEGTEVEIMLHNNRVMSGLLAHALACDQTRVASLASTIISLRLAGDSTTYHNHTHQDPLDQQLGYQAGAVRTFSSKVQSGLAETIKILADFKEGDGSLLDRTVLLATTDVGHAMVHSVENMPIITAGRAGGAMKTGIHVQGAGDPATRVGLTVLQALRVPVSKFGQDGNEVSRPWSEVLA